MRRWISVAAYAKREQMTERAARAWLKKLVWHGTWEQKVVLKKGNTKRVFFRPTSTDFPRHDGIDR